MGKRGPKAEPSELKLARGTFRAYRDTGRMDLCPPQGAPDKPTDIADEASLLWDRILSEHKVRGSLGSLDSHALGTLCRTYGLLCRTYELLKAAPTDKDTRCSYAAYVSICDKLGAKFGWTASDRAMLKLGSGSEKPTVPTRARA